MDFMSTAQRSAHMARIRSKDSKFEVAVRRALHVGGHRYRCHVSSMPGRPDLVFPSKRKVVFLNSCFWHAHGCAMSHIPKSRRAYWVKKLLGNRARDRKNARSLRRAGWSVMCLWECGFRRNPTGAVQRLARFLAAK
jgi:DNA mismatch endonuclease, patch repair protein